jgi:hypothetical protein
MVEKQNRRQPARASLKKIICREGFASPSHRWQRITEEFFLNNENHKKTRKLDLTKHSAINRLLNVLAEVSEDGD